MKSLKKFISGTIAAAVAATAAMVFGLSGNASAIACYQYGPNLQTSATPVFNNICNVPSLLSSSEGQYAIGDEPNFVRIRPNTSGNDTANKDNPKLVNDLTAACNNGDKFDVWTYIHNDASQDDNANGSGSAVAKDVKLALSAPGLNSTNSKFNFASTVSASNAASVTDGATLSCNGKQVKLKLVASSVHYNNNLNQTSYGSLADSSVNNTIAVGSPVWPSAGQAGNEWGCWDYRMVVVYQVQVEVQPPAPEVTATCDMFSIVGTENRTAKVSEFKYTTKNTNVKNVSLNWGDNTTPLVLTDASTVVGQTHQYSADGTYVVTATVTFDNGTVAGGANTACAQTVKFESGKPPVVITNQTPPTRLVNTGAGSVMVMFAAVTAAAAYGYRRFLSSRYSA
jgi:hypothetical protein